MIQTRAIGLVAVVLAFGFGFGAVVASAKDLRAERIVYHDVRVVI